MCERFFNFFNTTPTKKYGVLRGLYGVLHIGDFCFLSPPPPPPPLEEPYFHFGPWMSVPAIRDTKNRFGFGEGYQAFGGRGARVLSYERRGWIASVHVSRGCEPTAVSASSFFFFVQQFFEVLYLRIRCTRST